MPRGSLLPGINSSDQDLWLHAAFRMVERRFLAWRILAIRSRCEALDTNAANSAAARGWTRRCMMCFVRWRESALQEQLTLIRQAEPLTLIRQAIVEDLHNFNVISRTENELLESRLGELDKVMAVLGNLNPQLRSQQCKSDPQTSLPPDFIPAAPPVGARPQSAPSSGYLSQTAHGNRGFLLKQGSQSRLWKRRWFLLPRASDQLLWFSEEQRGACIGSNACVGLRSSPRGAIHVEGVSESIRVVPSGYAFEVWGRLLVHQKLGALHDVSDLTTSGGRESTTLTTTRYWLACGTEHEASTWLAAIRSCLPPETSANALTANDAPGRAPDDSAPTPPTRLPQPPWTRPLLSPQRPILLSPQQYKPSDAAELLRKLVNHVSTSPKAAISLQGEVAPQAAAAPRATVTPRAAAAPRATVTPRPTASTPSIVSTRASPSPERHAERSRPVAVSPPAAVSPRSPASPALLAVASAALAQRAVRKEKISPLVAPPLHRSPPMVRPGETADTVAASTAHRSPPLLAAASIGTGGEFIWDQTSGTFVQSPKSVNSPKSATSGALPHSLPTTAVARLTPVAEARAEARVTFGRTPRVKEAERQALEKVETMRRAAKHAEKEEVRAVVEKAQAEWSESQASSVASAKRLALQKVETIRLAIKRAQTQRAVLEQAEARWVAAQAARVAERTETQRAEEVRNAVAKAEAEWLAAKIAEEEQLAAQNAEAERAAAKRAVEERLAAEAAAEAEKERHWTELVEGIHARLVAEAAAAAEAERLASAAAEAERAAAEKAAAERLAARRILNCCRKAARRILMKDLARGWTTWYAWRKERLIATQRMRAAASRIIQFDMARAWTTWLGVWAAVMIVKSVLRAAASRIIKHAMARGWTSWRRVWERELVIKRLRLAAEMMETERLMAQKAEVERRAVEKETEKETARLAAEAAAAAEAEKEKEKRVQHLRESFARRILAKGLARGWTTWYAWRKERLIATQRTHAAAIRMLHHLMARGWNTWKSMWAERLIAQRQLQMAASRMFKKRVQHLRESFARRILAKDLARGWTTWYAWRKERLIATQRMRAAASRILNYLMGRGWTAWQGRWEERVIAKRRLHPAASRMKSPELSQAFRVWSWYSECLAAKKAAFDAAAAAEAKRLATEWAQREWQIAEKAEVERVAAANAEAERVAAVAAAVAEEERLVTEKAEAERQAAVERLELALERLEAERLEVQRFAAQKAAAERVDAANAEAERVAAVAAAAAETYVRLACETATAAEAERAVAERAETERRMAKEAEAERLAANERLRLALERLEMERLQVQLLEAEQRQVGRPETELFADYADDDRAMASPCFRPPTPPPRRSRANTPAPRPLERQGSDWSEEGEQSPRSPSKRPLSPLSPIHQGVQAVGQGVRAVGQGLQAVGGWLQSVGGETAAADKADNAEAATPRSADEAEQSPRSPRAVALSEVLASPPLQAAPQTPTPLTAGPLSPLLDHLAEVLASPPSHAAPQPGEDEGPNTAVHVSLDRSFEHLPSPPPRRSTGGVPAPPPRRSLGGTPAPKTPDGQGFQGFVPLPEASSTEQFQERSPRSPRAAPLSPLDQGVQAVGQGVQAVGQGFQTVGQNVGLGVQQSVQTVGQGLHAVGGAVGQGLGALFRVGGEAAAEKAAAADAAAAKSKEGHALNEKADFAGARDAFHEAYRMCPPDGEFAKQSATCLFSAGNMAVKANDLTGAKARYDELLALPSLDVTLRTKVLEKVAAVEEATAAAAAAELKRPSWNMSTWDMSSVFGVSSDDKAQAAETTAAAEREAIVKAEKAAAAEKEAGAKSLLRSKLWESGRLDLSLLAHASGALPIIEVAPAAAPSASEPQLFPPPPFGSYPLAEVERLGGALVHSVLEHIQERTNWSLLPTPPPPWAWRWEPGELTVNGNLKDVLDPLISFLEQNGFHIKQDKLSMHIDQDMLVVKEASSPPLPPPRGAKVQARNSAPGSSAPATPIQRAVTVPTLGLFSNGIEFASAAFTKWDRHLKTALKSFLNANLNRSLGDDEREPLRTGFGFGTEWNVEAVTALQIFLKKNGAADLKITQRMGLDGNALFGVCDNDPTIMALQAFLNRQMVSFEGVGSTSGWGR